MTTLISDHKFKGKDSHGCIVVTSPFDWLFAKGCLASLRWFMPHLPITLLIHGAVETSLAEKKYGIQTLRLADIPDPWLKQNSFGWGITKMVAVWHAPFERFLYLDADTAVWGDLQANLFSQDYDVVFSVPKPFSQDPAEYVDKWFFQPAAVMSRWPEFDWRRYVEQYACTGTFMLRRGCLKLERYRELLTVGREYPHLFKFGEMGMLNLMVFEAVQTGSIKFKQSDFQVIFPDHTQDSLRRRFRFDELGNPIVQPGDEQVLHMPDKKPLVGSPDCYSEPMTFFRLKYLEATEGIVGEMAVQRLRQEDAEYHQLRRKFLRADRRKKFLGLFKGHRGEWRRLFGRLKRCG